MAHRFSGNDSTFLEMPTKDPTNKEIDAHLKKSASGVYHAVFRDAEGKPHKRTTRTTNLEEARQVVRNSRTIELETAAKSQLLNAEALTAIMAGRKITCADAITEWHDWRALKCSPNTLRTQEMVLCQMVRKLGAEKWPIGRLKHEHLDSFVNDKKDPSKWTNRLVRIAAIRSFFDFLTARAYYVGNPSRLLAVRVNDLGHEQKERRHVQPITPEEYSILMEGTEGRWQQWISLAYWSGLRMSDCACLEWASVSADEIVVFTRKSQARVALPLDDELLGAGALRLTILAMMENNKHPKYAYPEERKIITDPARRASLSVQFQRILARCDISGKSFHSLRHAFATRLAKAGKKIEDIGRLMGHSEKSGRVTEGYIHKAPRAEGHKVSA